MCHSKLPNTIIILASVFALLALYIGFSEPNPEGINLKIIFFNLTMALQSIFIPILAAGALIKYLTKEH